MDSMQTAALRPAASASRDCGFGDSYANRLRRQLSADILLDVSADGSASAADRAEAEAHDTAPASESRMASEIYGLIVASSVLAAGTQDDDVLHVALAVLITLVVYWLAETYAHVMAASHVRGRRLSWARGRHDLQAGWPLVSASFTPLIVVVVTAVLGADINTAQVAGLICATVLLFISGWIAGQHAGATGLRRLLAALVAASFGLILIGLKAALH
jgi:hypothetical protein